MSGGDGRGRHARRWVTAQIPLLTATIVVPVAQIMLRREGPWVPAISPATRLVGLGFVVLAVMGFRAAQRELGEDLVATPMPAPGASLRQAGIYAAVRHPIYAALISGVWGWALLWTSVAGLGLAAICTFFFLLKSRYEEGLLAARFSAYEEYRRRVPAFIPYRRSRSREPQPPT